MRGEPTKLCKFGDICEFVVPSNAICSLDKDGATMQIALSTEPATTIFVGSYDVPEHRRENVEMWLRERMEHFCNGACRVLSSRGNVGQLGVSIEQWIDRASGYLACQMVGEEQIGKGNGKGELDWWFARLVSIRNGHEYFLMDWHGPRRFMLPTVLPVFESFRSLVWPKLDTSETIDGKLE